MQAFSLSFFIVLGFFAVKSYGSDIDVGFIQFMINQNGNGVGASGGTALPPDDEITASTLATSTTAAVETSTSTTTTTTTTTAATSLITTIQQETTAKPKKNKQGKNSMKIIVDCSNFCKRKRNGEYKGFCNKRRHKASCLFCRYVFFCGRSSRLFS